MDDKMAEMGEEDDTITVKVRCLDGTEIEKEVPKDLLVEGFKTLVADDLSVRPEQQRMIFRGRLLEDSKPLSFYSGNERSVVFHLAMRRDGPSVSSTASPNPQSQSTGIPLPGSAGGPPHQVIMGLRIDTNGPGGITTTQVMGDGNPTDFLRSFMPFAAPGMVIPNPAAGAATAQAAGPTGSAQPFGEGGAGRTPGGGTATAPPLPLPFQLFPSMFPFGHTQRHVQAHTEAVRAADSQTGQTTVEGGAAAPAGGFPEASGGGAMGGAVPIAAAFPFPFTHGPLSAFMQPMTAVVATDGTTTTTTAPEVPRPSDGARQGAVGGTRDMTTREAPQSESQQPSVTTTGGGEGGQQQPPNIRQLMSSFMSQLGPVISAQVAQAAQNHPVLRPIVTAQGVAPQQTSQSAGPSQGGVPTTLWRQVAEAAPVGDIMDTVAQTLVDTGNSMRNVVAGNGTLQTRSRRLPWRALQSMLQLLEEETGWRRPEIDVDGLLNAPFRESLAAFISVNSQAMRIQQSLLDRVGYYLQGLGDVDVSRLQRMAQLLTLSASIESQLAAVIVRLNSSDDATTHHEPPQSRPRGNGANGGSGNGPSATPPEQGGPSTAPQAEASQAAEGAAAAPTSTWGPGATSNAGPGAVPTTPLLQPSGSAVSLGSGGKRRRASDSDRGEEDRSSSRVCTDGGTAPRMTEASLEDDDDDEIEEINEEDMEIIDDDDDTGGGGGGDRRSEDAAGGNLDNLFPGLSSITEMLNGGPEGPTRPPAVDAQTALESMPPLVNERYHRWTGDAAAFAANVQRDARLRPFSYSYNSGNPCSGSRRPRELPAAQNLLSLSWRRAMSRVGITDPPPVPEDLETANAIRIMRATVRRAVVNPDFQQERQRYPDLARAVELFEAAEETE